MVFSFILQTGKALKQGSLPRILATVPFVYYTANSNKNHALCSNSESKSDGSIYGINNKQKFELEEIQQALAARVRESVDNSGPEEDAAWDAKKSTCSFCQFFMESPCAVPFRKWSRCVDLAKEDGLNYVTTCAIFTNALMACTESNAKYFEALREPPAESKSDASE